MNINIKNSELFILMLVLTLKLLCNILFMNSIQFDLFGYKLLIKQSACLYSLVFILFDICTIFFGIKKTYIIILFSTIMDAIYSFGVFSIYLFSVPNLVYGKDLLIIQAIHTISKPTLFLFTGGFIASLITYFIEVSLFNWLFKKIFKGVLWISSILSVGLTILIHSLILYPYQISNKKYLWDYILTGFIWDMILIILYSILVNLLIKPQFGVKSYIKKGFKSYFRLK